MADNQEKEKTRARQKSKKPKKSSGLSENSKSEQAMIPVVAIGASAGGLEPIEQFFAATPTNSACAFVIIQHLSPDFRSLMDELLARHSSMNIFRITNGMDLQPSCIYLNPPRSVLTVEQNKLKVEEINEQDAVYLPIDLFFQSMAQERGEDSIGLVLSGTGSDGTKGGKSIIDAGGKLLVQDPKTTRFEGMPRSVLGEVACTMTAAPRELAKSVQQLLNNEVLDQIEDSARQPIPDPLSDVLSMLMFSHGTDFLQYKEATIKRRIERRAHMRGIEDINDYRDILTTDTSELLDLYADLLIEVTEFFRDQGAFDELKRKVIPELTADLKDGSNLRVWVPGCASGEEAYSVAILLQEQARKRGIFLRLKIMATDIHIRSMNQASSGIYDESLLKNVPGDIVERYFDCAEGQAQIKPAIRNMVFFSTHDVTRDPPFTRIDLITCRNLLIYLKEDAQEKVMNLLHFSLRKGGYLFLGPSEHIGKISHEFDIVNEKWRIYKKRRDVKLLAADSIFQRTNLTNTVAQANTNSRFFTKPALQSDETIPFKRAHRAALESIVEEHAPPGFLLSMDGSIVHIFGDAAELIPMKSGSFSRLLIDLIRPELKVIVTAAIDHGRSKEFTGFRRAAYIKDEHDNATTYEVSLKPMELPGEAQSFQLLSIEKKRLEKTGDNEVPVLAKDVDVIDSTEILHQRISLLEHNLQSSEESLQSTIEELETSNEELQSTNEELMSSNEELQSTNEELHSVNEELYTVSSEHQRKNEELVERETDLHVLLEESRIGTIHLDENLCLRRYTKNARSVFNILPQDIGRPINHITVRASDQDVIGMVQRVSKEQETQENRIEIDSEFYLLRVMPYKSNDLTAPGVLITVIDVTDLENVRTELSDLGRQYKDILETTESFFVRWDATTHQILYCNEAYALRWQTTPEQLCGENIVKLRTPKYQKIFLQSLEDFKPNETRSVISTDVDLDGNTRSANIFTRAVSADGKTIDSFQSNGSDITESVKYHVAIERLFEISADGSLEYLQKLKQILQVGLDYFELDTAALGSVIGNTYEIVAVSGTSSRGLAKGQSYELSETLTSVFIETDSSLIIQDLASEQWRELERYQSNDVSSYVGATVHTTTGPFGSISFSSEQPRARPFTTQDTDAALIIATWIGSLIGNQEQFDFISSQSDYYKDLYLSIPAMMFLSDADGLIISSSDRLNDKLGLPAGDVSGKNCHQLLSTNDESAFKKAIVDGYADQLPLVFNLPGDIQLEVELNCRIKEIGMLKGVRSVVLTDVSDRNTALRQTIDQNQRLEAANENLNQFAFIASHDLQEPLRKIQQFSSFLQEDLSEDLTGDAKYHLEVVVDASERMSTLIYDLLRYSGASQEEPKIESVSLHDLLDSVQQDLELSISDSNARVEIGKLPVVQGDTALLRQLFVNLLSNSIKYRSPQRPPEIKVSAIENGLTIADNGIGFSNEFEKKIFDPFTRLHSDKEFKGNGIGLAICTTVCAKHHWTITASSEINVGTTFTIMFHQ